MANKKFSDFTQKTSTADVDFVVGYDGSDNVRISPSNLTADSVPLSGGTMTGDLVIEKSSYGGVARLQATGSYPQNGRLLFGTDPAGSAAVELKINPLDAQLEIRYGLMGANIIELRLGNTYFNKPLRIGADASANELDDFEQGTFTPSFDIAGGSVTASYSNRRKAFYTKVGKMVTVWMEFETNNLSLTGGTGNAQITGLPFTVGGADCCPIYIYPSGGTVTNLNYVNWNANSNISNAADVIPTAIPNTTYAELKYITHGNFYATMQSLTGTEAFRVHTSPTPAANAFAVTLTYYTDQ